MPDLATQITISMDGDGKFRVEADNGNVSNFSETELVHALEDIVYQFRGNRVALRTATTSAPAQTRAPVSTTSPTGKLEPGETHYNGGLGPRIGSINNSGMGL